MTDLAVLPIFGHRNRHRVAKLRRTLDRHGADVLAESVSRMSGSSARAALILAVATEPWPDDHKAALDP